MKYWNYYPFEAKIPVEDGSYQEILVTFLRVVLCSQASQATILYSIKYQFPSSKYVVYATALCIQRVRENHRPLKKSWKQLIIWNKVKQIFLPRINVSLVPILKWFWCCLVKRKLTAVNKHPYRQRNGLIRIFCITWDHLTFRRLQHTSSEVNGYNCYKH